MIDEKAVEKLAGIYAECVNYGRSTTDSITVLLKEFQADPLAYVKPKPLGWDGIYAKTAFGAYYQILVSRSGKSHCVQVVFKDGSHTITYAPTLEAAQAAAYEDLCNRVKELF